MIQFDITQGGSETIDFKDISYNASFTPTFKKMEMEGPLAYEYNPFFNIQKDSGELVPFNTEELKFDLNHPVDMTIQPSYDGSVNVILNDDKNPPRLINSRFTVTENKTYKRIDRKGTNDTNIYKQKHLEINTRLFKTTNKIPYIKFNGLSEGGNLSCGTYSFYFKYADADTNETDFICETGNIPVYVGNINDPKSIRGGIGNEQTDKIINLKLYNLDESYEYINIYYSRKSSDINGTIIEEAFKISNSKQMSGSELNISINGFEQVEIINIDDLNLSYNIVDKVKTQAQVQNTLFFANVDKQEIPYNELADLSLRIYPSVVNNENIGVLNNEYQPILLKDLNRKNGYYDAVNVYNYTGYWEKEIYRLGVFYIMKNDTLSPVFDIRGRDNLQSFNPYMYTDFPIYKNGKRNLISYSDDYFIDDSKNILENVKGVVRIAHDKKILNKDGEQGIFPLGLMFHLSKELLAELEKHVKGICFVRQKRIPTILSQGITIGVDEGSSLPMLYTKLNSSTTPSYITESFLNKEREIVHDFDSRIIERKTNDVQVGGLLSPEAMFKFNEFSALFTGNNFNLSKSKINLLNNSNYFTRNQANPRSFYIENYDSLPVAPTSTINNVKLTIVDDGKPTRYSGTKYFSSRAGIPEELYRFSFVGNEDKTANARNLVRGLFTGYIGAENLKNMHGIYDIHTPGYNIENMKDYFQIRFNSVNPYYSISDRFDIELMKSSLNEYDNMEESLDKTKYMITCYRGDCYISNITMRIQRNFQDPETPINDEILSTKSWKTNYKGYLPNGALDTENLAKINRSDINAVRIGHWATFMLMSNINFCYRTIDDSNSNEYALTGTPKSFYPLSTLNIRGSGKIQESYVYNSGYNSSVNSKTYHIVPDVPYINTIFSNRIMYSDISVDNSFKNGYRVFQGLTYQDLSSQYGSIVKLIEFQGALIIVFENGVSLLPVNERTLITNGEGGDVYINSPHVINKVMKPLSTNYGCSFSEGIFVTTQYVYGVDLEAKKIWRTNGYVFEIISDFKIQKFLNDNISLSERDKYPDLKSLNVKIHYNAFKQDVIFVFYKDYGLPSEKKFSITFNEQLNKFITFNSWYPFFSRNINNIFFSTDLDQSIKIANKSAGQLTMEDKIFVYKHGQAGIFDPMSLMGSPKPTFWYGKQHKFEYEFVVADKPFQHKIFDNLLIISNNAEPESFTFEVIGDAYEFDKNINGSQKSSLYGYDIVKKDVELSQNNILTDAYKTIITPEKVITFQKGIDLKKVPYRRIGNMHYLEDTWRVEIKPSRFNHMLFVKEEDDIVSGLDLKSKETRIRDKYCKIKVTYSGTKLAVITALNTLFTESFA